MVSIYENQSERLLPYILHVKKNVFMWKKQLHGKIKYNRKGKVL